jgi:ubiquitin C-terminal hydrolase
VRAYDAGIKNLGNTCFFNALLTCLSSAEPFVDRLLRHFQNHSALGGNAHCLRCRLASDCAVLCEPGRPESFGPDTAITLRAWAPHLATGGQQCVGEAFTFLVNALDTEDYNSIAHLLVPSQASSVQATTVGAENFSVAWHQTRRCLNPACGDLLVQPASNLGLQLELPPSRVTVLELLEEHFQTERIDDFQCETCDVRGTCEVSKPVHRWPPVLFLHVKRFRMDATGRMRKITEPLFFEELLESATFGVLYSLQAVAVHIGRFGSGHYVAYVRDSQDQWVLLNDAAAPTVVSFQEVQRKQAYILVFRLLAAT